MLKYFKPVSLVILSIIVTDKDTDKIQCLKKYLLK